MYSDDDTALETEIVEDVMMGSNCTVNTIIYALDIGEKVSLQNVERNLKFLKIPESYKTSLLVVSLINWENYENYANTPLLLKQW